MFGDPIKQTFSSLIVPCLRVKCHDCKVYITPDFNAASQLAALRPLTASWNSADFGTKNLARFFGELAHWQLHLSCFLRLSKLYDSLELCSCWFGWESLISLFDNDTSSDRALSRPLMWRLMLVDCSFSRGLMRKCSVANNPCFLFWLFFLT